MNYKQIAQFVECFGLPYTYDTFPNNIAPNPPYIVFNYPNREDFGADNKNYTHIDVLNLELYTSNKDFELEERIEAILEDYGFYYEKSEAYIRNEHLYQITYVTQFISNKENNNE